MTPKEKAIELVKRYDGITDVNFGIRQQKKCALIAVDEILITVMYRDHKLKKYSEITCREPNIYFASWWEEVKQEILKL